MSFKQVFILLLYVFFHVFPSRASKIGLYRFWMSVNCFTNHLYIVLFVFHSTPSIEGYGPSGAIVLNLLPVFMIRFMNSFSGIRKVLVSSVIIIR